MTLEVIESTAGEVAAELKRRGVDARERVTILLDQNQELIPGRKEARARVIAASLSDDDIDRLIKQAQQEIEAPNRSKPPLPLRERDAKA